MKGKWYAPMVVQLLGVLFVVTLGVFVDQLLHEIHDNGSLRVSFCFTQVDDSAPREVLRRSCEIRSQR